MASTGSGGSATAGASGSDEAPNLRAESTAASGVGAGSSGDWNASSSAGGPPRDLRRHTSTTQNSASTTITAAMARW